MATIQEEIRESFYVKLFASAEVDQAMIEALRAVFESEKKLKAADFVAILTKRTKGSTL